MAHSLSTLLDIPLVTVGGERRAIRNFLFDDRSWLVRFLVVDAGRWFGHRLVVIPVTALDLPNWAEGAIHAHLTTRELVASPHADEVRPVSRQQQVAWERHFGWRDGDSSWRGPSTADFPRQEFSISSEDDDPHLRRTRDLISYQVWAKDGFLGLLEGFFLEDASWHIGYLLAKTGNWIHEEKIVASSRVRAISWGQRRVVLDLSADIAVQQPSR